MLLNKFLKKIGSLTNRKKDNKPTNALPLGKKGRLGFFSYVAVVLCACCLSTTAFAAGGDPLGVVNNLSTFIFSLIRAIGMILLGCPSRAMIPPSVRRVSSPWPVDW